MNSSLARTLRNLPPNVQRALEWAASERPSPQLAPFGEWLDEVTPTWHWHWPHLAHIRSYLDRVTSGEIKRLMVLCPPRHGKTEQNTVRYPIYRIEADPTFRVIIGAYNQTLADKFSRKARKIGRDRLMLSAERTAAEDWETTNGGGVRAVGVGSGITGQGGDLILIDDPIKSREEAESKTYRDRCWDWYTDDIYTRLEPGGSIILTMTPWHSDDLAGRILASDQASTWTVVRLPAIAEESDPLGRQSGQALCPDRFDEAALADIRKTIGSYGFGALYQCRPQPAEGGRFKRSWFRYAKRDGENFRLIDQDGRTVKVVRPSECRRFSTVDLAFSKKETADFTVISAWAVDNDANLIWLDMERGRIEGPALVPSVKRMAERWNLDYSGIEDTQAQTLVVQYARRENLTIRSLYPDRDKVIRSIPAQVRMEAGQIYLPMDHPEISVIENEILTFDTGANDDIVDTLSYAAREVVRLGAGPDTPEQREARERAEGESRVKAQEEWMNPGNPAMWGDDDP